MIKTHLCVYYIPADRYFYYFYIVTLPLVIGLSNGSFVNSASAFQFA